MNSLFEVKVKYKKINPETGVEQTVCEPYLIDAVSFGEAEERATKEMEQMVSGDFIVTDIKRANYSDIFESEDGEKWYKSKISFVALDEKAGKEKKLSNYILVFAADTIDAHKKINTGLKNMIVDYEINSIVETKIVEIFHYFKEDEVPDNLKPIEK